MIRGGSFFFLIWLSKRCQIMNSYWSNNIGPFQFCIWWTIVESYLLDSQIRKKRIRPVLFNTRTHQWILRSRFGLRYFQMPNLKVAENANRRYSKIHIGLGCPLPGRSRLTTEIRTLQVLISKIQISKI